MFVGKVREPAPVESELLNLPFDQYQRYRVVQRIVSLLELPRTGKILDVGGYPGLITSFLTDYDTTVVDLIEADLPHYVRYDGDTLPFPDVSFDLACSCDVLEHVVPMRRPKFLSELSRVSRRYLVITAPFHDERTRLSEEILSEYIERVLHMRHEVLLEHLDNGLPDLAATTKLLESEGWACVTVPSGYLYRWLPMMMVKHQFLSYGDTEGLHTRFDRLYNLEFGDRDFVSPSYRQVIFAARGDEGRASVALIAGMFAQVQNASGATEPDLFALVAGLQDNKLHLSLEKFSTYAGEVLLKQIDELHEQLLGARQRLIDQETHIRNLDVELNRKFGYRLWSAMRKLLNRQ